MPAIERIPITLLTGFLGSGKTTLLARMLHSPAFAETAVLINELGAVGLDHHLARGGSETLRVLENGCVCCILRDDLASVLADLFWDRLHRRIPWFRQVVIETTGLADPGALLPLLDGSRVAAERFRWSRVVCTIDGVHGARSLERRPEAVRQLALADVVFVTKTDLVSTPSREALVSHVRAINPVAALHAISHGEAPQDVWNDAASGRPGESRMLPRPRREAPTVGPRTLHANDVHTFVIEPLLMSRAQLVTVLHEIADRHADALLRVKGLVRLQDEAHLTVVQMVHADLYPLQGVGHDALDASSALVFIVSAPSQELGASIEQDIRGEFERA